MNRQVMISLEAFGREQISRMYETKDLEGKTVEEIVGQILNSPTHNGEARVVRGIANQMKSSGGYELTVGKGGGKSGKEIDFQPVRLRDRVDQYVEDKGLAQPTVRIAVTGVHTVGSEKYGRNYLSSD